MVVHSIWKLRQKHDWTLDQLSTRCGLSVGPLSQVERGLSSLSIASLKMICAALGVPLTRFFDLPDKPRPSVTKAGCPQGQLPLGDSEVIYWLLSGSLPRRTLEAFIAEYPPKYESPVVVHEGEEFAYNLSGKVELVFEEEKHVLETGDSFQIHSNRPHTARSLIDETARILWVQTMRLLR